MHTSLSYRLTRNQSKCTITKKNNISNDILAFSKIIPYIHIKYIYSGY